MNRKARPQPWKFGRLALVAVSLLGTPQAGCLAAADPDIIESTDEDIETSDPEHHYPWDEESDSSTGEAPVVWTDPSSGLTWQVGYRDAVTYDEAVAYCDVLDLGGDMSWRLPTITELRSLVRKCPGIQTMGACGVSEDCRELSCGDDCKTGCDWARGPGPGGMYHPEELGDDDTPVGFCSSTQRSDVGGIEDMAWRLSFGDGTIHSNLVSSELAARCVL